MMRLLDEHDTAWAEQGRGAGDNGERQLIDVRTESSEISVCWGHLSYCLMLLNLLIVRVIRDERIQRRTGDTVTVTRSFSNVPHHALAAESTGGRKG